MSHDFPYVMITISTHKEYSNISIPWKPGDGEGLEKLLGREEIRNKLCNLFSSMCEFPVVQEKEARP